jgi:hypothetical protein
MNMPGFTAEASLSKSSGVYLISDRSSERPRAVIPQAPRVLDGFCIGNGSYCCFRGPDGKWTSARSIST